MATHDYVIANGTGAAVRSDLNGALAAIVSNNSSATAPATTYAYQWWADTTTGLLKLRNSANSAWISLFQLDGEWSTLPIENGTFTAPSIYFKDSGTDTGFYSPGADQIGISTGGTARITVDGSGNVNIDSNTLYVDAANNRVGIGTSSPGFTLDVAGTFRSTGIARLGTGQTTTLAYIGNPDTVGNKYITFGRAAALTDIVNIQGVDAGVGGANIALQASGGSVGIGTTDIRQKLTFGTTTASSTATPECIDLGATYSSTAGANMKILTYNDGTIRHGFGVSASASDYLTASSGAHVFWKGTSEVARIDSSSRLLVGIIASPAYQLQVSTDSAGKPSSALWTIVSDERIKEDIELADLDLCYEAIKAIPLKRYKWRDDIYTAEQVTDRRKLGWIAQDVEAIFPKAVGTHEFKYNQVFGETIIPAVEEELDADGNVITPAQPERIEQGDLISEDVIEDCRDLNSDQLYAAMYGAVQKLMAKVETLEASNADLLARLSALEGA